MADFTKRQFPTMSRVLYDFRQIFGDDVAYTYAKEGANEYGEKWQGEGVQPVLEERRTGEKIRQDQNSTKKSRR